MLNGHYVSYLQEIAFVSLFIWSTASDYVRNTANVDECNKKKYIATAQSNLEDNNVDDSWIINWDWEFKLEYNISFFFCHDYKWSWHR